MKGNLTLNCSYISSNILQYDSILSFINGYISDYLKSYCETSKFDSSEAVARKF